MVLTMGFNIPPITEYLRVMDENQLQALTEPSALLSLIQEIDAYYREEVFISLVGAKPYSTQLCLNAHMLLLATAKQALSGHP